MPTMEMIQEFAESLDLSCYAVMNNMGEIIDDALAIAGYSAEEEISLSVEYINHLPGFKASRELFQLSMDGQSLILLSNPTEILAGQHTDGSEGETGLLSFHIDDVLYTFGILVRYDN